MIGNKIRNELHSEALGDEKVLSSIGSSIEKITDGKLKVCKTNPSNKTIEFDAGDGFLKYNQYCNAVDTAVLEFVKDYKPISADSSKDAKKVLESGFTAALFSVVLLQSANTVRVEL